MIKRDIFWNAAMTAVMAVIGWLAIQQYHLGAQHAGEQATRFTQQHGDDMRNELTDVLADIDKRLAVMETNISWLREGYGSSAAMGQAEDVLEALPAPPAPIGEFPKYDLRQEVDR